MPWSVFLLGQAMSGREGDGLLGDDSSDDDDVTANGNSSRKPWSTNVPDDEGEDGGGFGGPKADDKDYFVLPANVTKAQNFKGIAKSNKTGEVEVTVKLPSR